MRTTDYEQFSELLTAALAFYRQNVSNFALDVWWAACERYDLEQVRKALTAHAMDPERGQFAPKPADLVRQLDGTATDRALVAWGKVHDAMSAVGAYRDVVFDDPAIHATVEDLGGWVKCCRGEVKDLSYLQHRFAESYRAYARRGEFDYPRVLIGDRAPDELFRRRGIAPPKPTAVGDAERARLVYTQGREGGKTQIAFSGIGGVLDAALKLVAEDA